MFRHYKKALLAAVLLLAVFYWLIEGGEVDISAIRPVRPPNVTMTDSVVVEDKDGKRSWELRAQKAELDVLAGKSMLTGVTGKFYRPAGGVIDFAAKGGLYDQKTKEITLTGDVAARYSEGWTLDCQHLVWSPADGSIVASGESKFHKEWLFVAGDRIQSER